MKFCSFGSGSSGNCSLISHGNTHILIDAGISMRRIKTYLCALDIAPENLTAILITHEHKDHIRGIQMISKYFQIPVYASELVGVAVCRVAPAAEKNISLFQAESELEIGGIAVRSFRTPHDTPESVGYRLDAGGVSFAFVTDLGQVTRKIYNAIRGVDMAVLESNHDVDMLKNGVYPYYLKKRILSKHGHLSNFDCGRLAGALAAEGTRQIVLAHLSRKNNTPQLAYETVKCALTRQEISVGRDVRLTVAPPAVMGNVYIV
jgi:phosphoribosyl 1,2-cyclic phosphodiesterase